MGNYGKHDGDSEHVETVPSIPRTTSTGTLQLELGKTYLPTKALRIIEHPTTLETSSSTVAGYHGLKVFENAEVAHASTFSIDLLSQILKDRELRYFGYCSTKLHPAAKGAFAAYSRTMDPQEESSSAASRREPVQHPYDDTDIEDRDTINAAKLSRFKTRATTKLCTSHQIYYSSQYTRPATEMLAELLEERYPVRETATNGEEEPLMGGERGGQRCNWLLAMVRYLKRS